MPRVSDENRERYQQIADEVFEPLKADGWTIEWSTQFRGMCYWRKKRIRSPRPLTLKSLLMFLHECAHAYLHAVRIGKRPRYIEEMEAEEWSRRKAWDYDLVIPDSVIERGNDYIARRARQAKARGAKLDPRVRKYYW